MIASTSRSYLASVHEDSSDAPRAAVCREQEQYNTLYPAQVKAMEERATKIGKPKFFYYMSPNNANWLNASQAAEVEALGLGDHVVSDQIARTHGIHGEQAREAIADCLKTGSDSRVERVELAELAAPQEDAEAAAASGEAAAEDPAEAAAPPAPASAVIPFDEVEAAHAKYLKRLARELTRFLTATGMAPRIRSVWVSGSGCRAAGVQEMLAAVFGNEPKELDVLAANQLEVVPQTLRRSLLRG